MSLLSQIRLARATLVSFASLGMIWGTFFGMAPATKAMLGVDDAGWGMLFLCSSTGAIFAMRFAPHVGRTLGRARLPVAGLAFALAFSLPAHLTAPGFFAAAMALVGMTTGTLDVLMNARVSTIEAEHDTHLMSLNHAIFSFAYAGAAAVTGLARAAGYGPAPVIGIAAALVAVMSLATIERDPRVDGLSHEPQEAGAGGLGPVALIGGLIILIGFLAENATEAWSALHIERTLGGARGLGSYGPALLGLTMGIGRMSGQFLSARMSERSLLRAAGLTAAVGAVVAALAPSPAYGYLGFIILGLGVSVIAPVAFALVGRLAAPARRTAAIARATQIGYTGFFIGPAVLGALSQFLGLRAAFGAVAVFLLLILPLLPLLARSRPVTA